MEISTFLIYLLVMAGVTYLIRVIPYVCMRKEVKNRFFKSFLAYIPYTVLAVMTVPAILFSTEHFVSALAGLLVGIVVAYFEKGLLAVALSTCGAVLVAELVIRYIPGLF
ncbi:MAG: AzlD domain-containing protein [Lachnospiraceae bacterium]|nr:AzlD domain-containing protein [Lachnospiraceae bacterium]